MINVTALYILHTLCFTFGINKMNTIPLVYGDIYLDNMDNMTPATLSICCSTSVSTPSKKCPVLSGPTNQMCKCKLISKCII